MLKRIVIENYRSCLRTVIDLHPNLSVLIGLNGSGKTNILQGVMFLNKMAQEGRGSPLRGKAITVNSRIKAVFQERKVRIQLNASIAAYTDESNNDILLTSRQKWLLRTPNGKKGTSFVLPLAVVDDLGHQRLFSRAHGNLLFLSHGDRFHVVPGNIQRSSIPILGGVASYCRGIRYYGASQFTNPGACPASFQIEQEGELSRLFRARTHTKILYDMYSAKNASRNSGFEQFMDIVGPKGLKLIDDLTFRSVKTSSTDYLVRVGGKVETRTRHKLLVIPQFRIGKQKLSPNQLSEGTFKTLALLFHVVTERSTAVLIEEPEVCIHHGLLSSILELIKSSSRHKQIVLSTHSDYVLDHVKPENVYRVEFERTVGTVVRHIPETMTTKEFSALRDYLETEGNLGEYWREGGLGDRP
jgi:AAA domain, putative AbiEii toxin, Type IV TA system/AAA ATPase domain